MTGKTNLLRKAMEEREEAATTVPASSIRDDDDLRKESRAQYRRYVDSINRSSDREIERALAQG